MYYWREWALSKRVPMFQNGIGTEQPPPEYQILFPGPTLIKEKSKTRTAFQVQRLHKLLSPRNPQEENPQSEKENQYKADMWWINDTR